MKAQRPLLLGNQTTLRTMLIAAVIAGAGCSHGFPGTPNSIIQVNLKNATYTQLANLSAFLADNPVINPNPPDFEPDGTFYSLVSLGDRLYTVEPNHREIDQISTADGSVNRVMDISETYGHIVPTALAYHNAWYFGNLFEFPIHQGECRSTWESEE